MRSVANGLVRRFSGRFDPATGGADGAQTRVLQRYRKYHGGDVDVADSPEDGVHDGDAASDGVGFAVCVCFVLGVE